MAAAETAAANPMSAKLARTVVHILVMILVLNVSPPIRIDTA
jgi:hypothetical protein